MWASRGPLSIKGGAAAKTQGGTSAVQKLRVIDAAGNPSSAAISPSTAEAFGGPSVFLQLAGGSDCVLLARAVDGLPEGAIALSAVQQHNLHLNAGTAAEFRVFQSEPEQPLELVDLELEVSLLGSAEQAAQVDAVDLTKRFSARYFGRILAVGEACLLPLEPEQQAQHACEAQHSGGEGGGGGETGDGSAGTDSGTLHQQHLLLRVCEVNTLSAAEQEEAVGYHCFRGLLTPDTQVYLTEVPGVGLPSCEAGSAHGAAGQEVGMTAGAAAARPAVAAGAAGGGGLGAGEQAAGAGSQEQPQPSGSGGEDASGPAAVPLPSRLAGRSHVQLLNARQRDAAALSRNSVRVVTSDGEWFPVRRKLLRPCIALTKAVRSEDCEEVAVEVDCLTFDRVLLFLEAEALGRAPPPFAIHFVPELLEAAQKLGLRSLEDHCRKRLGDMESRLRWFSLGEVRRRNAAGECLLILDGMVLDVTRWLPEHPGGATIIPRQSLNIDCSRFFELYHHSRESFLYIHEFYIGEILPEDRVGLPRKEPSTHFMEQLAEFTSSFRLRQQLRTHLGSRA